MRLVQAHGHNWKFMADNFLVSRASLSLKNRYTLLMRRLKRQENARRRGTGVSTPEQPQSHGADALLRLPMPFDISPSLIEAFPMTDGGFSTQANQFPLLSPVASPMSLNEVDPMQGYASAAGSAELLSETSLWNEPVDFGFEVQELSLPDVCSAASSAPSDTASNVVKYSVACAFNTTQKAVAHLINAAMSEVEARVSDENQVVVTLQLRV